MCSPRTTCEVLAANQLDGLKLPSGITAVELRRSSKRRKTVSARLAGDRLVIAMPAALDRADEQRWIEQMIGRIGAKVTATPRSDDDLADRAAELAVRYLDRAVGHRLRPNAISWVTNMSHRWGSCSINTGRIRISHRLQQMPDFVLDYIVMHELIHLTEAGHGTRFRKLLANYPLAARADGFLQGWSLAQGLVPNQMPPGDCHF